MIHDVVVIIVSCPDNVVTIMIIMDGNDPYVLVVLVMTISLQELQVMFKKVILVIVICLLDLEVLLDLLVHPVISLVIIVLVQRLVVQVIVCGRVVEEWLSPMMIFVDMVVGEQVEWLE